MDGQVHNTQLSINIDFSMYTFRQAPYKRRTVHKLFIDFAYSHRFYKKCSAGICEVISYTENVSSGLQVHTNKWKFVNIDYAIPATAALSMHAPLFVYNLMDIIAI